MTNLDWGWWAAAALVVMLGVIIFLAERDRGGMEAAKKAVIGYAVFLGLVIALIACIWWLFVWISTW